MQPATSSATGPIARLDYAILQQCMHCGMCLPTCPTYDATQFERSSPRGRIALMRAIADGRLTPAEAFADEMAYCLGCLACETACPAGVKYATLFEAARAEVEQSGTRKSLLRRIIRGVTIHGLFLHPRLLRLAGRMLWLYRACGAQFLLRALRLNRLLPYRLRELERITPRARFRFSHQLIRPVERPAGTVRHRVALLTGCVQDFVLPDVNRDTVDVLLANGCEVHTLPVQYCCGSLHAHNGETADARTLARRQIDAHDLEFFDAIITNAAGCGSHLKTYDHLLADEPRYADRAAKWVRKLKDIHEFLAEIGFRRPTSRGADGANLTYHEACHLCHGQKITAQPRDVLRAAAGPFVELAESTWCCGSAGVYNITQPEMAATLQERKMRNIAKTGAAVVATANPGCHLQLESGAKKFGVDVAVRHPVSLLAAAYRAESGQRGK